MASTVIVTMMSVHHNLARMGELVQMVLPSIIANVRRVLQVCLSVVFSISLVTCTCKNPLTDCGIAKKVKLHFGYFRGFIKFLCRRSLEGAGRAFLVFLMKESKKRRRAN